MDTIQQNFENLIPAEFKTDSFLSVMLIVCLGAIAIGLIARFAIGKRSRVNRAVSSAMCILCMYLAGAALFVSDLRVETVLQILPMVSLEGNVLRVFALSTASFGAISGQLLRLILLSFIMNLINTLLPEGKNLLFWYLYRIISIAAAVILELAVNYAVNAFLPQVFLAWAPAVLLGILVLLLLLGVMKVILGLFLAAINPILAGIYAFFFSNKIGKQLSTALLTTALLTALVFVLERMGCTMVMLTTSTLAVYVPYLVILLILWYVIGALL